ncbi:MAG: c-type cytochrome domain-containing protein [Planctomycetota bacterium]
MISMRCVTTLLILISTVSAGFAEDVPAKVTFEEHVKPIFRQYCLNCHHQGDKKGGLALDTFGSLMEGGGSGEIVFDDGDVEGSRLWQLVNHDDTPVMPPNQDKLPEDKLTLIRAWIEGGVLENAGSKASAKKKNALEFVASSSGKPEGPAAMPETTPLQTPVVTSRAPAISAIAASPWAPLVAVSGQNQVVLYHSQSCEILGILPFPEGIAQDLKFSRDGAYLIVGGGRHSAQGLVAVFDVRTGERVATIGDELDVVFGADVNDSMSRVALGGPQRMLRIFDAQSGEMLFDIKKHTDWIYAVSFSPDGVLVASADRAGGISVWETETGRPYLDLVGHKGAVFSLAWRDDSNVLASASADGTVKLWELNDGKAIRTINAHGGGVSSVAFDHQGRLATAGADNRAKLWDASGKELKSFAHGSEDMLEVAVTFDGKRVVAGNWSGEVFNCSVEDPKDVRTLAANPKPAEERIKAIQQSLTSAKEKLVPVMKEWEAAKSQVAAATKPLAELNQQIASKEAQIQQHEAVIAQAVSTIEKAKSDLPKLTLAARDLQDRMTAARVAGKGDSASLVALAELEEQLAGELLALAKRRKEQVALANKQAEAAKQIASLRNEVAALVENRPPLENALKQAEDVASKAEKKVEFGKTWTNQIQRKVDRYLAEIN